MVQFIAFFGAFLFDRIAKKIGDKRATLLSLCIWIGCITYVYHIA